MRHPIFRYVTPVGGGFFFPPSEEQGADEPKHPAGFERQSSFIVRSPHPSPSSGESQLAESGGEPYSSQCAGILRTSTMETSRTQLHRPAQQGNTNRIGHCARAPEKKNLWLPRFSGRDDAQTDHSSSPPSPAGFICMYVWTKHREGRNATISHCSGCLRLCMYVYVHI